MSVVAMIVLRARRRDVHYYSRHLCSTVLRQFGIPSFLTLGLRLLGNAFDVTARTDSEAKIAALKRTASIMRWRSRASTR